MGEIKYPERVAYDMDDVIIVALTSIITAVITAPLASYISYKYGRKSKLDEIKMKAAEDMYSFLDITIFKIGGILQWLELKNLHEASNNYVELYGKILKDDELYQRLSKAQLILCDKEIDKEMNIFENIGTPRFDKLITRNVEVNEDELNRAKDIVKKLKKEIEILRKKLYQTYFT